MVDKRTGAKPKTIGGVAFHCYHTGILRYQWRSEDGRCAFGSNPGHGSYYALVDGERLGKRFRYERTAMQAAFDAAYRC